jgi:hypothetical protein
MLSTMHTSTQYDRAKPLCPSNGIMGLIWLPDSHRSGRWGATDGVVVLFLDPEASGWRLTCDPLFSRRQLFADTLDDAQHEAESLVNAAFRAHQTESSAAN